MSKIKVKKCKWCGDMFMPRYKTTEKTCFPPKDCAWLLAEHQRKEKERKKNRSALRKFNEQSLSWQHEQTQREFNKYIKLRDHDQPCISCGAINVRFDAGHYRTKGAAPHLRYHEDNCHKQCSMNCNKMRSGNVVEYRIRLVEKIGVERVEAIEANNTPRKYTIDELIQIRAHYKQKAKQLKSELESEEL